MSRRGRVVGAVTGALAGGAVVVLAAVVGLGGGPPSDTADTATANAAATAEVTGAGSAASAAGTGGARHDGSPARLAVHAGYVPQPVLADLAAAYLTITNTGGTDAELTSVTTPLAAHVTLHIAQGSAMRQAPSLTVPAGGRLVLGPGGDHLMLENLVRRPDVGDTVTLVLHFAHVAPATVTVRVPVRPTTYSPTTDSPKD